MRKKKVLSLLLAIVMVFSMMAVPGVSAFGAQKATTENIGDVTGKSEDGNVLIFQVGGQEVRVELCTPRTVRVQLSLDGADGYRPEDPQYYMVQKNEWDPVDKTVTDEGDVIKIRTSMMEIRVQKSPLRIGMYDNRLTARAYKISCDGSLGARSAWLLEDYSDQPGHKGNGKWTNEQLYTILYEARKAGFQTMCHAIGDGANRQCLDVYERLLKELPDPDARLRIEHAQILAPEDIPRFHQLGIIPTHQTVFLRTDKRVADQRLGAERIKGAYAWRTLIDQGNPLPNGTDSPVENCNPFVSMYCAITRKDEKGLPENGWHPEQAMTREEALRSYTTWGAYAGFEENLKGSIEAGKLADFVIIDRDLMNCPAEEIKDIRALETVVGGETVYQQA